MRLIAVLLLLYKCLIFLTIATEPAASETCPLKICSGLLKDVGATETQLKALETRLANSEARIEEMKKEYQDRTKVAFSVSLGSNSFFGPVDTDSTLVYKNVFINVGDAYNRDTGIFTAPVQGVYYFSFFYHCSSSHGTMLDLYRNKKLEVVSAHHKNDGHAENGGSGLTLLLEKGDQVYIVLRKDNWIWDSDIYNVAVFSGFLIDAI
ncbi:Cerebellin-4 [Anabarilius grahami]|uniref:Cerebellin-4 n=1 Tax=Anabarilius grahami TaxID=495550 RepID=A0A3N0YBT3_ANAGA|nr:Cerebellin-4 [Anabarilius grahami]